MISRTRSGEAVLNQFKLAWAAACVMLAAMGARVAEVEIAETIVTLPATGVSGLTAEGKPCFPNAGNLFGDLQAAFSTIAQ